MKRLICMLCVLGLITSTGLVNAANYTAPQPRPPLRPPVKAEETGEALDYYKMQDISTDNSLYYDNPNTINKIEFYSDTIIEGRVVGDGEQVLEYFDNDSKDVFSGYTRSKVQIDKVYRGDVRVGDTITVTETYYILNDTVYHPGLYYPSEKEKTYLWFLIDMHPDYDNFALVFHERGRFPVLSANTRSANQLDSLSRQDLNLSLSGDEADEKVYRDIFGDVVAKYMNGAAG